MLPALDMNGMFAVELYDGAVNTEKFVSFIRDQVVSGLILCLEPPADHL